MNDLEKDESPAERVGRIGRLLNAKMAAEIAAEKFERATDPNVTMGRLLEELLAERERYAQLLAVLERIAKAAERISPPRRRKRRGRREATK